MDIIHPNEHTFPLLESYVKQYEEKCVLLCSHVRRHCERIYIIVNDASKFQSSLIESSSGSFITKEGVTVANNSEIEKYIMGVIRLDSTLFHCIPNPELFSEEDCNILLSFIKSHMLGKKVKCISGEEKGTSFLAKLCEREGNVAYQVNQYKLMTLKNNIAPSFTPPLLCDDDKIIRCTEKEIEELIYIQHKYLQDEVAPKGRVVNELEVKITLRQILKNQLCLALFNDGIAYSKANTNAIGINWVQLGGVYTHPLFRRNGYAINLVYTICKRALKVHKNIALFVKEKNQAAIDLYKKLGFIQKGIYKIVYF